MNSLQLSADYVTKLSEMPIVATYVIPEHCIGLPQHLKGQPQLHIGLNMRIAIPDLEVDARGIRCTLSFGRRPHYVVIPWNAVLWFWEPGTEPTRGNVPQQPRSPIVTERQGNVTHVDFKRKKVS